MDKILKSNRNLFSFRNFLFLTVGVFLLRLLILIFLNKIVKINFFYDETYYWYWSKHLDFGYYSKPPLIAWTIFIFTEIFGDNFLAIKLPSNVFYSLSAIFVYLSSQKLFKNETLSFWSGVVFLTMPAVSFLSMVISTDCLLVFFWIFSFYFLLKFLEERTFLHLFISSIGFGLGLLSKPTMIIFIFSMCFLLFEPEEKKRITLKNLIIFFFIGMLVYLPNLLWNINHDFIMFRHIKDISEIGEKPLFNFKHFIEFMAAQLLVFSPIFFIVYLVSLKFSIKSFKSRILVYFSLPFLLTISIQALLEKANANWALPTYLTASILVVIFLFAKEKQKLLKIGVILNIILAAILYFYKPALNALGFHLTRKTDIYKRVSGWKEIAKKIESYYLKYKRKGTVIAFTDRPTMSQMIYYLKPKPLNAVYFNPSKVIKNQFAISTDANKYKGKDFFFITKFSKNYFERYFDTCEIISSVSYKLYPDFSRKYNLIYCKNFKGY